jgi:putative ABC transport system ATP-binding protein
LNRSSEALHLSGVRFSVPDGRGTRTILDGVDLSLEKGESVYLTGPSGSGKSTLLSVAGLLLKPDQGEVRIMGTSAGTMRDRQRTRLRRESVAFIYQSANLLPSLTAREQLELMAHIRGESRKESVARAKALLEDVGLAGRQDQLPSQLSGGERQRVGIARALMCRPHLILADEPTASLDPGLAGEIHDLLVTRSRESEIATLVVTHDEAATNRGDRRIHLDNGLIRELEAA